MKAEDNRDKPIEHKIIQLKIKSKDDRAVDNGDKTIETLMETGR